MDMKLSLKRTFIVSKFLNRKENIKILKLLDHSDLIQKYFDMNKTFIESLNGFN